MQASVLGSNKRWQRWTGGKCAARAVEPPRAALTEHRLRPRQITVDVDAIRLKTALDI